MCILELMRNCQEGHALTFLCLTVRARKALILFCGSLWSTPHTPPTPSTQCSLTWCEEAVWVCVPFNAGKQQAQQTWLCHMSGSRCHHRPVSCPLTHQLCVSELNRWCVFVCVYMYAMCAVTSWEGVRAMLACVLFVWWQGTFECVCLHLFVYTLLSSAQHSGCCSDYICVGLHFPCWKQASWWRRTFRFRTALMLLSPTHPPHHWMEEQTKRWNYLIWFWQERERGRGRGGRGVRVRKRNTL